MKSNLNQELIDDYISKIEESRKTKKKKIILIIIL